MSEYYWKFYSESEHRARKQHQCECCNRKIKIGNTYKRVVGVCDGDFVSLAFHVRCLSVYHYLVAECGEAFAYQDFKEVLRDHTGYKRQENLKLQANSRSLDRSFIGG